MKKITALVMLLLVVLLSKNVSAANDNHTFAFTIKPNYENSYYYVRFRETTNVNNKWKVNLKKSTEGTNVQYRFWLTKFVGAKAGSRVSDTYKVILGTGDNKFPAYSTASRSDVSLSAENTDYSTKSFAVSGYWDEEIN